MNASQSKRTMRAPRAQERRAALPRTAAAAASLPGGSIQDWSHALVRCHLCRRVASIAELFCLSLEVRRTLPVDWMGLSPPI